MRSTQQRQTPLEREVERLQADGYIPIDPRHNAIKAILADLGKADLSPQEVEALCQTAKCVTLNGFVRYDLLPCGCGRVYRGLALGIDHNPQTITLKVGGIEGVKPCPKHTELVKSLGIEAKLE